MMRTAATIYSCFAITCGESSEQAWMPPFSTRNVPVCARFGAKLVTAFRLSARRRDRKVGLAEWG